MLVVVVLAVLPGPDTMLIIRNTLAGGWRQGAMTTAGVSAASAFQGLLVSLGLAAVIIQIHPLFLAVKWAGIAYLIWLAFGMLRAAIRGAYRDDSAAGGVKRGWAGFRQGFTCNITNPKIMMFYLSLLAQFVGPDAPFVTWLAHAWFTPLVGFAWCLVVVTLVGRVRGWLQQRVIRRVLDSSVGLVLVAFSAKLASDS